MTDGFGAVVDELHLAATTIGTIAGRAAGIDWHEPSGDYGHAGLQSAYAEFLGGMKQHVGALADTAHGHGDGLKDSANAYHDADTMAADELAKATGGLVGGAEASADGGGADAGAEAAGGSTGAASSSIARRLNPGVY